MREAAYGMLPDEDRVLGHYLAGCYLEKVGEHDPLVLAEHFQRSNDFARAIVLFTRAAEQSFERNDLAGTLHCTERGLSCHPEGEMLGAVYALQTAAWFWRNDLERAFRIGSEALALLAPGTIHWFRAINYTTVSAATLGKRAQVSELALRFGSLVPSPEIIGSYIEATSCLTIMLGIIGDREMAELFLSHTLEVGGPAAGADFFVCAWLNYAHGRHTSALQPAPWSAVEYYRVAVAAFERLGDRRMHVIAGGDLGFALTRLGAAEEAEAHLREALRLGSRLDEPTSMTWAQMYLALILAERADPGSQAEAEQLARDILRIIGEQSYYSSLAYCALAAVHSAKAQLVEAEEAARKALAILLPIQSSAPLAFTALGLVLLRAGRVDEAVHTATEGVSLVVSIGGSGGSELALRRVQVEALKQQGATALMDLAQAELDRQLELRAQQIPDALRRASFRARYEARGRLPLF